MGCVVIVSPASVFMNAYSDGISVEVEVFSFCKCVSEGETVCQNLRADVVAEVVDGIADFWPALDLYADTVCNLKTR